jgi:hypothetical protein
VKVDQYESIRHLLLACEERARDEDRRRLGRVEAVAVLCGCGAVLLGSRSS